MSTSPSLSVIVPFFDSERFVGTCVDALLAQEGVEGSYEVILVDNGSRDRSQAIVAQRSGLVILQEERPGAYAARNTGIRHARAPIIAFTDADCVVDPDWLRAIQLAMRDPALAILVGEVRYPSEASSILRLLGAWENAKTEYALDRCKPSQRFAYANNMAVRTSVFEELGPFRDWRRAADTELVHRLAARRPDLQVAFRRSMRITHFEFTRASQRARRLLLYSKTNARIDSFEELGALRRLAALRYLWPRKAESRESVRAQAEGRR